MTLLLVTGCYKDEFGQIQKEIKNLQDSQIAPLEQQLKAIQKSHSELNILSDELREYVALLEEASKELEGNIGKINEKIQELKQSLNDKNVKEKGEVLARLENAKSYLEGQLATMKSTVDVLKDKYDGIQSQMDAMDALLADKYASKDWVNGTFATIEQQNALISEVSAVKVLANELNATALKIESDVKTYMAELRESTLGTVDSSISAKVGELTTAYESAIGAVVANVTAAFNAEIKSAIETSETGILSWVDEALKDYLTTAEAEAKLAFYKGCIGAVPDGESLQSQIDDLGALIDGIKPEIEAAYKEAIKKAIEESEGKLTKELTGGIESIKLNELKLLTDGVSNLGGDVTKLWEDLGKLEKRINDLESQVAAINTTLAVILGETAPTLEEYISALNDELRGNDNARTAYLNGLVADLQNAVDGKDNDKSLQRCIEDIKSLIGTLPAGETSIVEWVQSSKSAIDLQLKSYATIAYVDGLRHEIDSATTDHSNRLDIISGRLGSAIEDSKTTICSWISEALTDYMRGAEFDARLQTLVEKYEDLFSKGDQGLQNQIDALSISVRSAIAELQEAYKTKIDTCITEYNSYVVKTVDAKYEEVKGKLDADSTKFDALEAIIDGMKNDVKTLNDSIDSLRDIVDSLQKFVLDKDYPSLKAIVRDFDAKLKGLTGIYADLKAFNDANEAVNKVGGYRESIEKLADFKKRLEEAEAAIANYKNLAKDFDLKGKLKDQFDALNDELSALKTAVFGSSSLRSQLEAIVAKDTELASAINALNATLLSRLQSYTSIAFRPSSNDGSATFTYDAEKDKFSSTLNFDVRPKALASSIASNATVMYVLSPTRSLVNLFPTTSTVTSPGEGQLSAVVTLPGSLKDDVSKGMSLALFAKGTGFDFASEFIPVSGDRMFLSNNLITCDGYGTRSDVTVSVYFPDSYTSDNLSIDNPSSSWVSVSKTKNTGTKNGLRFVDCTVSVKTSKDKDANRTAAVTFSVGSLSRKLTCTLTIIQDPREIQEFVNFNPADGKIKFSWKGYVIDTLTNIPTDQRSQTITVTTGDALTDWKVEKNNTSWVSVSHDPDLDKLDNTAVLTFEPGNKNANYNQSGTDKTGYLTFTSATGSVFIYTFTQLTRPQQRLDFDPDTTVGLTFGYNETTSRTINVTSSDGEPDWEYECDSSWISFNRSSGEVSVQTNQDTIARTGHILFTTKGQNPITYSYPIHQEKGVIRTFTFEERTKSGSNNQYYHIDENGQLHIAYSGSDNKFMYVYVNSYPDDNWKLNVSSKEVFLHVGTDGGQTRKKEDNKYYVYIKCLSANTGTEERYEEIVFTCDGKDYKVKVYQDARPEQRLTFDPTIESGGLSFGGRKTTNDNGSRQVIGINSSDDKFDYDIEVADEYKSWLHFGQNQNKNEVRVWTDANPDLEKGRTGYITFTTKGQNPVTYSYPVHQDKGVPQTFMFSPRNGQNCYLGEDGLIHISYEGGSKMYVYVKGDPNDDWTMAVNDAGTGNWLTRENLTDGRKEARDAPDGYKYYIQINASQNDGDSNREASIRFTCDSKNYDFKVIQEGRPAQTFTFRRYSDLLGNEYDDYVRVENGVVHVKKDGRNGDIRVFVTGNPDNDNWTLTYPSNSWISRNNGSENGRNETLSGKYIQFKAEKNNGVERTAVLTFNVGGKSYPYTIYQDSRTPYTFNLSDKSYDYTAKTPSFDVVTDPSGNDNRDWNVKVLDSDGSEVVGDFWLKAENKYKDGKVYLTLSQNGTEERKAQLLFYTFEGETAASAKKITITQTARPAQTFTAPDEGQVFEYEFVKQENKSIPVTTSDGLKDWILVQPSETWLTVSKKADGSELNVNIDANDGSERTATVKLLPFDEAASGARTFTIKQKAHETITVSFDETSWAPAWTGGNKSIGVTPSREGFTDWDVEVSSEGAGWLTATKNAGSTGVELVADMNTTIPTRSATITFKDGLGENFITVKQNIRVAQILDLKHNGSAVPSDLEFDWKGDSYTVSVDPSDNEGDWSVTTSDWISVGNYTKDADGNATVTFTIPQLPTKELQKAGRTGTITFTTGFGGNTYTINVAQTRRPTTTFSNINPASGSKLLMNVKSTRYTSSIHTYTFGDVIVALDASDDWTVSISSDDGLKVIKSADGKFFTISKDEMTWQSSAWSGEKNVPATVTLKSWDDVETQLNYTINQQVAWNINISGAADFSGTISSLVGSIIFTACENDRYKVYYTTKDSENKLQYLTIDDNDFGAISSAVMISKDGTTAKIFDNKKKNKWEYYIYFHLIDTKAGNKEVDVRKFKVSRTYAVIAYLSSMSEADMDN